MVKDENITVRGLQVAFPSPQGQVKAVDGVDLLLPGGSFTAIIGESGCGKSVLGQALLGVLPAYAEARGLVEYQGQDVLHHEDKIRGFYGGVFGVVPQNPGDALSPARKIGKQMQDILTAADISDRDDSYKKACLEQFGLREAERVLAMYPHELSGGMQQRVLCAMSVSSRPRWILADEPTKGLDERVCATVYDNLRRIRKSAGCGMVIITHDLELARQTCDSVAVMYAGQILETGTEVLTNPKHPYTRAFLASLPENGFLPMRGQAPAPGEVLPGCKFASRCDYCSSRCLKNQPPAYTLATGQARCFLYAAS